MLSPEALIQQICAQVQNSSFKSILGYHDMANLVTIFWDAAQVYVGNGKVGLFLLPGCLLHFSFILYSFTEELVVTSNKYNIEREKYISFDCPQNPST